ncbi:MAG TPA: NAD(P)/FAD-dependent oxidoreductase [Solirubrobacteraceae bacterium]|nr:NAD(P)/FAD-dependent oxidoreductase [Solirubrobacteraceae bacterium]
MPDSSLAILAAELVAPAAGLAIAVLVVLGALWLSRGEVAPSPDDPHRVVVVGGGFGGLQAVVKLARAPVEVTLVDRRNFHLFQPLVYQVATGGLSPGEIAAPLRAIFKRRRHVRVLLGEVTGFDLEARTVRVEPVIDGAPAMSVPYDSLIVSGGSHYSYFGHEEWRELAPEVKTLESALDVRQRILRAFEAAELEPDPERRAAWLTFAVVGAGPTGVEMAGQIAELANDTLRRDFRAIDPRDGRILLVEAGERVLSSFPPSLSASAARALEQLGVTPLVDRMVVGIDGDGVTLSAPDDTTERVPARTVIWAAGVAASSLAARLGEATGAELDRVGRVTVEPDLTLPGRPEVFALGDMVRVRDASGDPVLLPGVAPVAMQQGRYAASLVRARLRDRRTGPFRYVDKGNVATIGRARAVADIKGLRLSGPFAWLMWLGIHIFYLIGFENRLLVLTRWAFGFVTRGRGARLITAPAPRPAGRRASQGG